MARERVQVQGLGGAVPGIQPTIQRAGQYSVQVQRAGRNKLMDLADALGQVNPVLQQYTRVADLEAEQFEEEMAGKSLEEQQAILKKTEDELDKETRRGVMGWLTSPLNQKRKRQAIGQLASRDLVNEIEARLINPKQGDPEDLTERANLVRQEFIDNTPALRSSVFAQEGLNRASNTRIQETVANYERREEVIAKGDTAFGTTSVLYELAKDGSNLGDYTPRESESMLGAWDNLNAFSAAEQRDILGKVFENLAKNVSEEKADSLLLWASKNLNIGAAKMTELEYDGYSTMIDRTAAAAESLEEKERADLVKQKVAQFQNAHTDIEIDGQGTYNGQTYNSVDELILATKKDPAFDADQVGLAQLRRNVDDFIKTDIDPKEFRVREVLRSPFGPANAIDLGLKDLNVSYETAITSTSLADDVLMGDEELVNIQNFYMDSFQSEIEDELNSLLSSPIGSDRAEVTRQIKDFIRTRKKEVKREQENAIQQRLTFLKDKEEVKVKVSASKKATEPNTFGGLFDDAEDKELKVKQDLMVFSDVDADTKERRKAFKNLRNADAETTLRLRLIARGEIPKIKAEQPKRYYSSRSGFGGTISKEVKRVEYTLQERKEALNQLVQIEAARGKLGDALLLDQTVTKDGDRFNPKLLNSAQFPLVSKEDILELVELLDATEAERKANKVFQEAVKKANKIGEDDVLEFIRNQREIFKSGLNEID
jgi:hypothetical protein